MSDNRSEELAKLLEIPFKTEYQVIDHATNIMTGWYISERPKDDENYLEVVNSRRVYPNFERPENFVKLLELLSKNAFKVSFFTKSGNNKTPRKYITEIRYFDIFYQAENIIVACIKLFEDDRPKYGNKKETFNFLHEKQQAQQINWSY